MRVAILAVVISYLAVGVLGVALHWYAGTQITPIAHSLNDWYLYRNPQNKKLTHITEADVIFPAIFMGLAVGSITARRSKLELVWYIFIFPLGIAALEPIYVRFFPGHLWWSMTGLERAGAVAICYTRALMIGSTFACVARLLTQYFQGRTPDE
jgi:hypothetical protein